MEHNGSKLSLLSIYLYINLLIRYIAKMTILFNIQDALIKTTFDRSLYLLSLNLN